MSFNKVVLSGNVCGDPEIKTFNDGGKIANVSLATNERAYKTKNGVEVKEKTDFHILVVRNPGLVTIFEQYVHKGDKITVSGALHYRKYTDKQGVERTIAEIHVSDFDFCGGKKDAAPTQTQTHANDGLPF